LGAADAGGTFGCMSLKTGGLGPLPQLIDHHSPADFDLSTPAGASQSGYMMMFATAYNGDRPGGDEILIGQCYVTSGGVLSIFIVSILWDTPGSFNAIAEPVISGLPGGQFWPASICYPYVTRVATASPTTTIGQPVVEIPLASNYATTAFGLYLYPDPAAPSAYGIHIMSTGLQVPGFCFVHQGRICMLDTDITEWPTNPALSYFDIISYSDPANSETWLSTAEVFGPENPYGYGAVSSVSAGELFMVKTHGGGGSGGGGIVVQGDLNNPTITTLPGVKSTGPIYGRPDTDQNGAYYCVQNEGAWVWNGGNASTKISQQLDDNFFVTETPWPALNGTDNESGIQPYGYFCQRWGDWMLFSNNWIYNSSTGGWWTLYSRDFFSFFYYSLGFHSNFLYAGLQFTNANADSNPFLAKFDRTVPTLQYQWASLPIRPSAVDRSLDIREVTIRAVNAYADAGPSVQLGVVGEGGTAVDLGIWTMDPTNPGVQIHSFSVGRATLGPVENISLTVQANGTGSLSGNGGAPVIYDITVQYRVREQVPRQ
jgi:hypothetical protein